MKVTEPSVDFEMQKCLLQWDCLWIRVQEYHKDLCDNQLPRQRLFCLLKIVIQKETLQIGEALSMNIKIMSPCQCPAAQRGFQAQEPNVHLPCLTDPSHVLYRVESSWAD